MFRRISGSRVATHLARSLGKGSPSARGCRLAEEAVEKLQEAEERIRELGGERRATRHRINEANVMVPDAAKALRFERSRVKAAEEHLRQLELRVRYLNVGTQRSTAPSRLGMNV